MTKIIDSFILFTKDAGLYVTLLFIESEEGMFMKNEFKINFGQ